jgi:hypothetical protein
MESYFTQETIGAVDIRTKPVWQFVVDAYGNGDLISVLNPMGTVHRNVDSVPCPQFESPGTVLNTGLIVGCEHIYGVETLDFFFG